MSEKRSHEKRTAADFLAMLSQVVVPDPDGPVLPKLPGTADSDSDDDDISLDLPDLQVGPPAIDFESWFNGKGQPFGVPRPPLRHYKSEFGLVSSTAASIPGGFPPLNAYTHSQQLQDDPLAPIILDYRDVLVATDSLDRFRRLAAAHVVNHIYNDIAARRTEIGRRDSTFTPTIALVICPYRHQAFQFVSEILKCLPATINDEPFEVEHLDRLRNEFSIAEVPSYLLRSKPKDWLSIFGGHTGSDFKLGIRFFAGKIALCQQIAKSQLVVASPLGLFTFMEETDCMSSIEILVLDCLDGLLMEPWDRVAALVSKLNGLPKSVSGTHWERLRTYCADRNHSQMRQNIAYGSVLTPEVHSMFASFTNLRGAFIVRPATYPKMPTASAERMLRKLNAPTIQEIGDTLGRFFEDKMIAMIKKWRGEAPSEAKRTIVYFVSSLRFLHARKLLEESNANFLETGDDANEADGKRMRRGFKADANAVLLMTERFYFHYRLPMGPAGRVVFMQPPTFPHFASELAGTAGIIVYYTEFDEMALERVVGSRALSRVISTDTFVGL